jgi:hypothetical protein
MNLVQIAEDLKGLPTQALQGYMNGSNPSIPPYLAAAEMQRRQSAMKQQQMAQGAAQGKMPSVKEQMEQAAASMTAQAQRRQQGLQQLAQQAQRAPGAIPAGTPQPRPQPEPEPQVAMAGGGIVRLPVRESMFRAGGVVGYAEGGMSMRSEALQALIAKRDQMRKLGLDTTQLDAQIKAAQGGGVAEMPMTAEALQGQAYKAAQEAYQTPTPTPEQQIEMQGKLEAAAGMPDYMKRLQALEEKYGKSIEGRGLENLMRGLAASSRGRGAIGLSAAESAARDREADMKYAADLAAAYGGLSKDRFGALSEGLRGERRTAGETKQAGTRGLVDLAQARQQAETQRAGQESNERIQRAYAARPQGGGAGSGLGQDRFDLSVLNKQLAEVNNQLKDFVGISGVPMIPEGREKEYEALKAQKAAILAEIAKLSPAKTSGVVEYLPGASAGKGINLDTFQVEVE